MKTPVRWEPYLWEEEAHPADPREFAILERQWKIKLPEDYKQAVCSFQGMTPRPNVFQTPRGEDVFSVLLTASAHEGLESYSVQEMFNLLRPHVPAGIYPFGTTPGSEHLCFDYRNSPERPEVVLVTMELQIIPVARSFQELLESLKE
jgi:hypothetical protein